MNIRLWGLVASATLICMGPLISPSLAVDTAPPVIKAAVMIDSDLDDRADGVKLTYNESIRHAADSDGTYPFAIDGYSITAVRAARDVTTLKITVAENGAPDISSKPSVTYTRTTSQPVRDAAGNQAKNQIFTKTKALDLDGDGFTKVGGDCNPRSAAIGPAAVDRPDVGFIDADCDGMDGRSTGPVFVSPLGDDANDGTKAAPLKSLQAGIDLAASSETPTDVYVAAGTYEGPLALATGVGIFGAFNETDWSRSLDLSTTVVGSPEAALADGDSDVVLQLLSLRGEALALPGSSAYGLRAINGSSVLLQKTKVASGNAVAGANGANIGANGVAGAGFAGGNGGQGGFGQGNSGLTGQSGEGPSGGSPGAGSLGDGAPGQPGGNGSNGSSGTGGQLDFSTAAGPTWNSSAGDGGKGGDGVSGSGGGGGGGGGGTTVAQDCGCTPLLGCDTCYNAQWGGRGGNGGAGGSAGLGGDAGKGGGGSFAIYLVDSTVISMTCEFTSGNGGKGGEGKRGGLGGSGGAGEPGSASAFQSAGDGASGGSGGRGGLGAGGGGGAGGPSVGILKIGSSALTLDTATVLQTGIPGAGGVGAPGGRVVPGLAGENGEAHLIYPPET